MLSPAADCMKLLRPLAAQLVEALGMIWKCEAYSIGWQRAIERASQASGRKNAEPAAWQSLREAGASQAGTEAEQKQSAEIPSPAGICFQR